MFITQQQQQQQQRNDELMCLMKGFRTYSYNDPHPNSLYSHLFSPKSSGYYVPRRNLQQRPSHCSIPITYYISEHFIALQCTIEDTVT